MSISRLSARLLSLLVLVATLAACGASDLPASAPTQPSLAQAQPTAVPPTRVPSTRVPPTARPTRVPPTVAPTVEPTVAPTVEPTVAPTAEPTADVAAQAAQPTSVPAAEPAVASTAARAAGPSLARGSLKDRPYVVMIDNHRDAYPQSGLDRSALVFEALAEYGVTRFMAVYTDAQEAAVIGPVRSARIYYVWWATPFRAVFSHAGGSPDALEWLSGTKELLNLEQILYEGVYSWRSKKRLAPHNMYTSTELMRAFRTRKSEPLAVPGAGFLFRDPVAGKAEVTRLNYFFIDSKLPVSWRYDATLNAYRRVQWGKSHIDAASGEQVTARSVLALEVPYARRTGDAKARIDQDVIGSGAGRLFVEGRVQKVTWSKPDKDAHLRIYDAAGKELVFPTGRIWIAALPTLGNLSY